MRIAVLAHGSRGDIQPTVALGDELARRGHQVVLTVNRNLAGWAAGSGLRIVPLDLDSQAFVESEQGRRFLATGRLIAFQTEISAAERRCNVQMNEAFLEAAEGADLLVATALTLYRAQAIQEKQRVRTCALLMMPIAPTGGFASMLSPVENLGLPWLNRASHLLLAELYWRDVRGNINQLRARLGLDPVQRRPRVEELPSICAYSPLVWPRPEDWPAHHRVTGHCTATPELRQRLGEQGPGPALDAWLGEGEAPVFFGFGSMPVLDPAGTLRMIEEVARARGVRALVGAGWSQLATRTADPGARVFVAPAFDHDAVLPRCRAAIHHGGAGTTATALRAGLPSLVLSVFGDQPWWGRCLERLGAGLTFPFGKLDRRRLAQALDRLLDPAMKVRAAALGDRLREEQGTRRTADLVEALAQGRGTSS